MANRKRDRLTDITDPYGRVLITSKDSKLTASIVADPRVVAFWEKAGWRLGADAESVAETNTAATQSIPTA